MTRAISYLIALLAVTAPIAVYAQFYDLATGSVTITLTPAHPSPGDSVQLTLASGSIDLNDSDITWQADGRTILEGRGETTATQVAGDIGSSIRITAIVNDGEATAEATIEPTEVDLLWESDSYVPPFYHGRSLPSAGATVRLLALANFTDAKGVRIPDSQIRYTWKRNGGTIGSISGRGRSSASIDAPYLFGADTITVEAEAVNGRASGEASVRISSIEPIVTLYEANPVFGVQYNDALGTPSSVSESEMTFRAEPYFADARSPADPQFDYSWSVNQRSVPTDLARPNEITVDASGGVGTAQIELLIEQARNLFFSAEGMWNITFSAHDGATGVNPFTGR